MTRKVRTVAWTRWFGILALSALALDAAAQVTKTSQAADVRQSANVRHTGTYALDSPPSVVQAAFRHPRVMAALWLAYAYDGPPYQVTSLADPGAVHVVDPSGIVGDVWPLPVAGGKLAYLADGKVNHWAVPLLNSGVAVFDIALRPSGKGTQATVSVAMKADSRVAGAALWVLSPLVKARIASRLKSNLTAMSKILAQIAADPAKVSPLLQGGLRQEFDRTFTAANSIPATPAGKALSRPARAATTSR